MDYYVRAFCIADEVPPVSDLLQWLQERDVRLAPGEGDGSLESSDWQRQPLRYKESRQPFILECRRDGGADSPMRMEIDDFIRRVNEAGTGRANKRIVSHLRKTKFIVACQLPVDDMDESGWDANGQILTYYAENCKAILQADREGFYERSVLILKIA